MFNPDEPEIDELLKEINDPEETEFLPVSLPGNVLPDGQSCSFIEDEEDWF